MTWSRWSLRTQLTVVLAAAAAIAFAAVGTVVHVRTQRVERQAVDAQLIKRATQAAGLARLAGAMSSDTLGLTATRLLSPDAQLSVAVDGQTLIDVGPRVERSAAAAGCGNLASSEGPQRACTARVAGAVATASMPTASFEAPAARAARAVVGFGVAALICVVVATSAVVSMTLRPLRRLTDRAKSIGVPGDGEPHGDSGRGPAEIAALSTAFSDMLVRLQDASRQTEESLEAARRFTADAAHELRTPLMTLGTDLDVLRTRPDLTRPDRDEIVDEARGAQRRIASTLGSLLQLARGDSGGRIRREAVAFDRLVAEQTDRARARHPEVSFKLRVRPTTVDGSPDGLGRVVINLLENAAQHAGERPTVDVALTLDQHVARLTVSDDGPGIPADERKVIFERFSRGRTAKGDGSGLGLAIVAQEVELHGGELELCESTTGGACFAVTLPIIT